ncbi:MAG: hypothetical protein H6567_02880 [Lewinellaceae bacterium]|nr:hypothetical protein [Lewinellaceae bacterium]
MRRFYMYSLLRCFLIINCMGQGLHLQAQRHSVDVRANVSVPLLSPIYINDKENVYRVFEKVDYNYDLSIGYQYKLLVDLQAGIELGFGTDLYRMSYGRLNETYNIFDISLKENNVKATLKIGYVNDNVRFGFGYGLRYNTHKFTSGYLRDNFHTYKEPTDLSKVKVDPSTNQFYTVYFHFFTNISNQIKGILGLSFTHNYNDRIIKDIFEVRSSYLIFNLGALKEF